MGSSTGSENLAAALRLAELGFGVIPCNPADKSPLIDNWPHEAASDIKKIRLWWRRWPNAVPGLVTGKRNGIAVVDLDVKNGKDGVAAYRSLGLDPEDAMLVVRTATGGLHLYFEHERGLRNAVNVNGLPGIDIRGDRGYVIGPGAITKTGPYKVLSGGLEDLDLLGFVPFPKAVMPANTPEPPQPQIEPPVDLDTIKDALRFVPNDGSYQDWFEVLMAIHDATGGSDHGRAVAHGWSAGYPGYRRKEVDTKWASFGKQDGARITVRTLFARARENGWTDLPDNAFEKVSDQSADPARAGLQFLSPDECADLPPRDYVVKGLIAPGQIGCIFGEPGAGKSVLSPWLAYAVAKGEWVFGLRTRAGGAFFVACEDETGMAARITALRGDLGKAENFHLVARCSDLFSPGEVEGSGSPHLRELLAEVKERRPGLIVIDTLAMAMPGLEENDASAMSKVVSIGRDLARYGAAVIFIHHGAKSDGTTPRGHSVFNGALDFSIMVKRADENGVVHGNIKKNRNGPPDLAIAFRIGTRIVSKDIDGDEVTAPICEPCKPKSKARRNKLSPAKQAALQLVSEIMTDDGIPKSEWLKAAIETPKISKAENESDRRRAASRALESLAKNERVFITDDVISLSPPRDDLDFEEVD